MKSTRAPSWRGSLMLRVELGRGERRVDRRPRPATGRGGVGSANVLHLARVDHARRACGDVADLRLTRLRDADRADPDRDRAPDVLAAPACARQVDPNVPPAPCRDVVLRRSSPSCPSSRRARRPSAPFEAEALRRAGTGCSRRRACPCRRPTTSTPGVDEHVVRAGVGERPVRLVEVGRHRRARARGRAVERPTPSSASGSRTRAG